MLLRGALLRDQVRLTLPTKSILMDFSRRLADYRVVDGCAAPLVGNLGIEPMPQSRKTDRKRTCIGSPSN